MSLCSNNITFQFLPYLNSLLLPHRIPRLTVLLQQSDEEAVCASFAEAGSQTLSEWFQAPFGPLSQQRNQPGGENISNQVIAPSIMTFSPTAIPPGP